jgi:chorismate dehydratase
MSKIKVGAVSYLNTKPLIYGFQKGQMGEQLDLLLDYPSRIATQLVNNEIDIGLVPVAIIPALAECYIISDYCIGSKGAVASVCLFSDVPIQEVKEVLLDYQSRTSVQLLKILLKEYWKVAPVYIDAKEDFRHNISEGRAGLVIGDRAFQQRNVSKYVYDLGEAWYLHTGLSFVYAVWVSNKKLDNSFTGQFNKSTCFGLSHLQKIAAESKYPLFDLYSYFSHYISYDLDDAKRRGMQLFLEKIKMGIY